MVSVSLSPRQEKRGLRLNRSRCARVDPNIADLLARRPRARQVQAPSSCRPPRDAAAASQRGGAMPLFRQWHGAFSMRRSEEPCNDAASAAMDRSVRASGMSGIEIRERPSPNHSDRGEPPHMRPINMLVLHYTGMQSAEAAIERLCDPAARVSAHYVVEEDGTLWRLVPEERRAFHAGVSCWQGESDLNYVSIGIEIVNPGHEWGYRPFPEPQMGVVERLCRDLVARYRIPSTRIVGHSDIAPDRKTDPGEL